MFNYWFEPSAKTIFCGYLHVYHVAVLIPKTVSAYICKSFPIHRHPTQGRRHQHLLERTTPQFPLRLYKQNLVFICLYKQTLFFTGILHKGDGTNIYLNEQPRKIITILGTGKQRRLDCKNCNGATANSRLMAPVALASGRDGSLYIGDFNYIRKLSPGREDVQNILQLK